MPSYIFRDIDSELWRKVKDKAQADGVQFLGLVENLFKAWLYGERVLASELDRAETRKEWAWEHAAEVYKERDLLVRALSLLYPSHLMYRKGHQSASGPRKVVVCIHAPTGQLAWTIPETMRASYGHLKITENDWDGHKTAIRTARLVDLKAGG